MNVTCALCGNPVQSDAVGVFRKTTGWAEQRGASGGANAVALPERHDQWAHGMCVKREARGVSARQPALADFT
jgi:hypothetical protein